LKYIKYVIYSKYMAMRHEDAPRGGRAHHKFSSLDQAISGASAAARVAVQNGEPIPDWAERTLRDHRRDNKSAADVWNGIVIARPQPTRQAEPQSPRRFPWRARSQETEGLPKVEVQFTLSYQHSAPSDEHPEGVTRHKVRIGEKIVDLSDVDRRILERVIQTRRISSKELWADALQGHRPITEERKRTIKNKLIEKTTVGDKPLIAYKKGVGKSPSEWSIKDFDVQVVDPNAEQAEQPARLRGFVARAGTLFERRGKNTPTPVK
jgi:hypothetical protein